jgi:DNA-directed RNA polymerase subunit RPC12/RpoP
VPVKSKRIRARLHWRVRAARRYAVERARAVRCPWRVGRNVCGAILEIWVDRNGHTQSRCPRCERREAGLCQDCPRPVESNHRLALRCADCKHRVKLEARRRYYYKTRPQMREVWRERMRAFREAHPRYYRIRQRKYRMEKKRRILRGVA